MFYPMSSTACKNTIYPSTREGGGGNGEGDRYRSSGGKMWGKAVGLRKRDQGGRENSIMLRQDKRN